MNKIGQFTRWCTATRCCSLVNAIIAFNALCLASFVAGSIFIGANGSGIGSLNIKACRILGGVMMGTPVVLFVGEVIGGTTVFCISIFNAAQTKNDAYRTLDIETDIDVKSK